MLRYEFFLYLYPPKSLNVLFSNVHFSKIAHCSTESDELCRISTCMYTSDISQPNNNSRQWWDMNFFRIYIFQKLETRFSQEYIFQNSHFICSLFRFCRAIRLVFFWNMLIWLPTTKFCGRFKIHFSDKGNLFLERITYDVGSLFLERITYAYFGRTFTESNEIFHVQIEQT